MCEQNQLRKRRASPVENDRSKMEAKHEPTRDHSLTDTPRTWRFYVRWFSRFAIVIVLILSNARLVTIPNRRREPQSETTALLVITHSRSEYLMKCLDSILKAHPRNGEWPIIVSMDRQDGEDHVKVADVVEKVSRQANALGIELYPWAHAMSYENDVEKGKAFVDTIAYRRISRHYEWALTRIFGRGIPGNAALPRVVIVEDDMEVAGDFFSYFDALTPLLETDETLFCVSAWNDNGIQALAQNATQLHRTDFFPGLGWMLTRELWEELRPKWPKMFWDDWMRSTDQTKGRQCIRPEMSRTANFGEKGVSQSFHFKKHVSQVALADEKVDFSGLDLGYLEAERYHDYVFSRMSKAVYLKYSNYLTTRPQDRDVIAVYHEDFLEPITKRTGVMGDHRNGMKRTSYKGVIIIPWNGNWAFIVQKGWTPPAGYQLGSEVCC